MQPCPTMAGGIVYNILLRLSLASAFAYIDVAGSGVFA